MPRKPIKIIYLAGRNNKTSVRIQPVDRTYSEVLWSGQEYAFRPFSSVMPAQG